MVDGSITSKRRVDHKKYIKILDLKVVMVGLIGIINQGIL